jgi:RNA polymerase sigma factor (sigma-70 family)
MTEKEFNNIFNANWTRIIMYAKWNLNEYDLNDAKEIAIQVFYKMWESQPVFVNEIAARGWLYIATKRSCINLIKRNNNKKEVYTDHISDDDVIENDIILFEIQSELLDSISKSRALSKKERMVFRLYYLNYLTPREIATIGKVSLSTINSQLNQLHNKLRRLFKKGQ